MLLLYPTILKVPCFSRYLNGVGGYRISLGFMQNGLGNQIVNFITELTRVLRQS
jgi:hypothetical protein